jgi:hypothetical protein
MKKARILNNDESHAATLMQALKRAQRIVRKFAKHEDLNKILNEIRGKDSVNE